MILTGACLQISLYLAVYMKLPATLKRTAVIVGFSLFIFYGNAFCQNQIRPVEQLSADTSGLGILKDAIKIARNKFEVLPADPAKAKDALYQMQVSTRSMMGAIIYYTGGILIDNGWIRILGSGNAKLTRSLPAWNKGKTYGKIGDRPDYLLIGDDVAGGFFALNAGGLGSENGKVYYLAPDDLKWESLHISYFDFVNFCLVGNLDKFYTGLRWANWKADMSKVSGDEGFSIIPSPWTNEGKEIDRDSKKVVPIQQLYYFEIGELNKVKK